MKILGVGGGAFKGAYSKPIIQWLLDDAEAAQRPYDAALATSVGALELAMELTGQREAHDKLWSGIHTKYPFLGIPGFLRPIWWKFLLGRPPPALFDASPLYKNIQRYFDPKDLRCPLGVGSVDKRTGEHHTFILDVDTPKDFAVDAVYASAMMCTIMRPAVRDGVERIDGGHAHVVPPMPKEWRKPAQALQYDIIFHQELQPEGAPKPEMDVIGNAAWSFDYALRRVVLEDYEDLHVLAYQGARVRVWAPRESIGGMLDTDRETIDMRIQRGIADIARFETLGAVQSR